MASKLFDDLGALLNPLERQFRSRDPSIEKSNAAIIKSKIEAALKAYPEWAKQQRDADPQYLASLQQQQQQQQSASSQSVQTPTQAQGSAAPTSIPGYAQRRAAAAKAAQADMRSGPLPTSPSSSLPPPPPTYAQRRAAAAKAAQADLKKGTVPPSTPKPDYRSSTADIIRQRQKSGMTESKFSYYYNLLENALYEQVVEDPGSFANYITNVLRFDLNANSEFQPIVNSIDKDLVSGKSDTGYANARKILDLIFKTQISGTDKGGISQGIKTSSGARTFTGSDQLDRVVNGIKNNYYTNDELNALFMNILTHMKRKNPDQYNLIVRDVRGALADFQSQNSKK